MYRPPILISLKTESRLPDHYSGTYVALSSDYGIFHYRSVGENFGTITDFYIMPNVAVRSDEDIRTCDSVILNCCGRTDSCQQVVRAEKSLNGLEVVQTRSL